MPLPLTVPPFGDADLPAMMADFGVPVTVGTVAGLGILNEADEILVQDATRGGVTVLMTTVTVQTTKFPTMKIGDAVVAGSVSFTIRERLRVGDGALTKLLPGV